MSTSTLNTNVDDTDIDRVFDLLSHRYRRWLIGYMLKFDKRTISVETAVQVITTLDPPATPDGVYQNLTHNHLQKLDRRGVIDYNREAATLTLQSNEFIESLVRETFDWDPKFTDDS